MNHTLLLLLLLLGPCLLSGQSKSTEPQRTRLDINSASQAALETLPGIGPERASWMVETRKRNGPVRCVAELRAMPRLSDRQFEALRQWVFVVEPDPSCRPQPERSAN